MSVDRVVLAITVERLSAVNYLPAASPGDSA
jgi:hypothetical protein